MPPSVTPGYPLPSTYTGIRVQSRIRNQAGGIWNSLRFLHSQQISSGDWIPTGGYRSATLCHKPSQTWHPPHRWDSGRSNIVSGWWWTCPIHTLRGNPWCWAANISNTRSCWSCLCTPSLGGIYIGAVQVPEQTSCHIFCTAIPPHLHLLFYHHPHHHLLHTKVFIHICLSSPLCWNTCIHQNPPPRYSNVLRR